MTRLIVYSAKNPAEIFLDTENFGSSRFLVGDLWLQIAGDCCGARVCDVQTDLKTWHVFRHGKSGGQRPHAGGVSRAGISRARPNWSQ